MFMYTPFVPHCRYVMPDQKTVYSTDDGSNTGFWKFVADKAGDMSSGTLYGAKFTQISDVYGEREMLHTNMS